MRFVIFEKGYEQKNCPKICILFLIFEKGYEQKNCAKICKYSFFNI